MSIENSFQHIKETILKFLKEGNIPDEKAENFLSLTKTWQYHHSKGNTLRRDLTFKKIRRKFFSKCTGNGVSKENQIRIAMREIIAELNNQKRLKQEAELRQQEAIARVTWEYRHDPDQATELFSEEYLMNNIRFS